MALFVYDDIQTKCRTHTSEQTGGTEQLAFWHPKKRNVVLSKRIGIAIFAAMKLTNDLLLRAAKGENIERYPVWLIRQAGRILPEYRAVRNSLSGFKELVETPELAAEVTIQPVTILDVDAAIIFSDILVIPEAIGLPYQMLEQKGPWFEKTITQMSDLQQLNFKVDVEDGLSYVLEAIKITKKRTKWSSAFDWICGSSVDHFLLHGRRAWL